MANTIAKTRKAYDDYLGGAGRGNGDRMTFEEFAAGQTKTAAAPIGDPKLTIKKRNEYTRYQVETQSEGQKPLDWPAWLDSEGFVIDGWGHVAKREPST